MISRCGNGIIVLSDSLPVFTRVGGYLALCTATVTLTLPMSIQGSDVSYGLYYTLLASLGAIQGSFLILFD